MKYAFLLLMAPILLLTAVFSTFYQSQNDAKEVVIKSIENSPLVVLGERHGLIEQHEFFYELLNDERVQSEVDFIFFEVANSAYQAVIDNYVSGEEVSKRELQTVWQDMSTSPFSKFENGLYGKFFAVVRKINQDLPKEKQYRIIAGDPPLVWPELKDGRESFDQEFLTARTKALRNRDQHYYNKIKTYVYDRDKKGIAIIGKGHIIRNRGDKPTSLVDFLETNHPGNYQVFVPTYGLSQNREMKNPLNPDFDKLVANIQALPANTVTRVDQSPFANIDGSIFFGDDLTMDSRGNMIVPGAGKKLKELTDYLLHFGKDEDLHLQKEIFSPEFDQRIKKRTQAIKNGSKNSNIRGPKDAIFVDDPKGAKVDHHN